MYKKREPHSRGSLLTLTLNSVDDVWRKCRKNAVYVIFCMDVQIDRLGQIRLKIPIIDFASMTYLPETRSKSTSNLAKSFTKDLTLSMEFNEILTVFIGSPSLCGM